MKCQILFSEKNKENVSKCHLEFFMQVFGICVITLVTHLCFLLQIVTANKQKWTSLCSEVPHQFVHLCSLTILCCLLFVMTALANRSDIGIALDNPKVLIFFIAPACSRVRYRRPIFCPSVRPSVRPSVNIYVDVRHLCQS